MNNYSSYVKIILSIVCFVLRYIVDNFFWMIQKSNDWTFRVAGLPMKENNKPQSWSMLPLNIIIIKKMTKPTFSEGQTKKIANWISSGLVLLTPFQDWTVLTSKLRIGLKKDSMVGGGGLYISTHALTSCATECMERLNAKAQRTDRSKLKWRAVSLLRSKSIHEASRQKENCTRHKFWLSSKMSQRVTRSRLAIRLRKKHNQACCVGEAVWHLLIKVIVSVSAIRLYRCRPSYSFARVACYVHFVSCARVKILASLRKCRLSLTVWQGLHPCPSPPPRPQGKSYAIGLTTLSTSAGLG